MYGPKRMVYIMNFNANVTVSVAYDNSYFPNPLIDLTGTLRLIMTAILTLIYDILYITVPFLI